MNRDIPPALTAEEWVSRTVTNRDAAHIRPSAVAGYVEFDINEVDVEPYTFAAEQTVAIANAARPDDDPGKITRADVRMLVDLALHVGEVDRDPATAWEITGLAAKLAALLPPPTGVPAVTPDPAP